MAANTTAKAVAEAVNIEFDKTGVTATASTNAKIQASGSSAGAARTATSTAPSGCTLDAPR